MRSLKMLTLLLMVFQSLFSGIPYMPMVHASSPYPICDDPALNIPVAECEALMKIYTDTSGPTWLEGSTTFGADPDVSTWLNGGNTSLILGDPDGDNQLNVIEIQMLQNNLQGVLPNVFSAFTQLQKLVIAKDQATLSPSTFPDSLCSLNHLTHIDMHIMNLYGALPSCISNISSLEFLELRNNNFSGPIPDALVNLGPQFTELALYSNNLNADTNGDALLSSVLQTWIVNNGISYAGHDQTPAASELVCDDSYDNDADGDIDCNDSDCSADPACSTLPAYCGKAGICYNESTPGFGGLACDDDSECGAGGSCNILTSVWNDPINPGFCVDIAVAIEISKNGSPGYLSQSECEGMNYQGTFLTESLYNSTCGVSSAVCGNGIVESGEVCDDGNAVVGDGCDASCVLEQDSVCYAPAWNQIQCTSGGSGSVIMGGSNQPYVHFRLDYNSGTNNYTLYAKSDIDFPASTGMIIGTSISVDTATPDMTGTVTIPVGSIITNNPSKQATFTNTPSEDIHSYMLSSVDISAMLKNVEYPLFTINFSFGCFGDVTIVDNTLENNFYVPIGFNFFADVYGSFNSCNAVCGNSIIDGGEFCDDGNAIAGDGCSSCALEAGAYCATPAWSTGPCTNGGSGSVQLYPTRDFSIGLWLGGSYDSNTNQMLDYNGNLSLYGISLVEPFSSKGFLMVGGSGTIANTTVFTNEGVTDWVLVNFLDVNDSTVLLKSLPALVTKHGIIINADGSSFSVPGLPVGEYYIEIRQRNHATVRSSTKISTCATGTISYDFKSQTGYQTEVETGVFAMIPGDVDHDDYVDFQNDGMGGANGSDGAIWQLENGIYEGFFPSPYVSGDVTYLDLNTDLNSDGSVDASDSILFETNSNKSGAEHATIVGTASNRNSLSCPSSDTTAPSSPTISSPVNGGIVLTGTPLFLGSGEVGVIVFIKNASGVVLGTGIVNSFGSWGVYAGILGEGVQQVFVTQLDTAGNESIQTMIAVKVNTNNDLDEDAIPDPIDEDVDGDSIPNISDTDIDNDGISNTVDLDDDGDALLDGSDSSPLGYIVTTGGSQSGLGGGLSNSSANNQQMPDDSVTSGTNDTNNTLATDVLSVVQDNDAIKGNVDTDIKDTISYDDEIVDAYTWAKSKNITTMDTKEKARLFDSITRGELAKMMVNFSTEVAGKTVIDDIACSTFKDMPKNDKEIQEYMRKACSLGLMGRRNTGGTIEYFRPYDLITRAEFAAVLSRFLFGNVYNKSDGEDWYFEHLRALHMKGYMNKIDTPLTQELRGFVLIIMKRIAENNVE